MLQLLDLARENAALKSELSRIREEAEMLQRLGRFVEAMLRDQLPCLVVPANAVRAWQEREPLTWAMVRDWLAEQGRTAPAHSTLAHSGSPVSGRRPSYIPHTSHVGHSFDHTS
jgi:hypothetical protein